MVLRETRTVYRVHALTQGPIWFGPGRDASGVRLPPRYRFDDPLGVYDVCYAAREPLGAFVETFLRDLPARAVAVADLKVRGVSQFLVTRTLGIVKAFGPGLVALGTTGAIGTAKLEDPSLEPRDAYAHSQAWSRALHDHPDHLAGIAYRSSHDDTQFAVALFSDRASRVLAPVGPPEPLHAKHSVVLEAIRRYGLRLL